MAGPVPFNAEGSLLFLGTAGTHFGTITDALRGIVHLGAGSGQSLVLATNYGSGPTLNGFGFIADHNGTTAKGSVGSAPSTGQWYHLALRYDRSGSVTFFVNGAVVGTASVSPDSPDYGTGPLLTIAQRIGEFFAGKMDDLRVYSRPIPDAHVAKLAAGDDVMDASVGFGFLVQPVGPLVVAGAAGTRTSAVLSGTGRLWVTGLSSLAGQNYHHGFGPLLLRGAARVSYTRVVDGYDPVVATQIDGDIPPDSLDHFGSGGLIVSGVAVTAQGLSHTATGKITLSGVATARPAALVQSAGGVALSGTASTTVSAVVSPTGRLVLSGVAAVSGTATFAPAGPLVVSGVATARTAALVQSAGRIVLSGVAGVSGAVSFAPAGTLVLSGVGRASGAVSFVPTGQLTVSGQGSANFQLTANGAGLLRFDGLANIRAGYVYVIPGGPGFDSGFDPSFDSSYRPFRLTGAASVGMSAVVAPTGGLVLSGTAPVYGSVVFSPSGRLTLSGLADTRSVAIAQGTGAIFVSGAAGTSATAVVQASGPITVSGAASVAGLAVYDGSGSLTVSGAGFVRGAVVTDAAGLLRLTGLSELTGTAVVNGTGPLAFTGTATVRGAVAAVATGAIVLSGASGNLAFLSYEANGLLVLSGAVVADRVTGRYESVGAVVLSGEDAVPHTFLHDPVGGLVVSGTVPFQRAFAHAGRGKVVLFDPALVAWYRFSEGGGSVAGDSSTYERTADLAGGTWVPGTPFRADNPFGLPRAVHLDGLTEYGDADAVDLTGMEHFTLAMWARADDLPPGPSLPFAFAEGLEQFLADNLDAELELLSGEPAFTVSFFVPKRQMRPGVSLPTEDT